MELKVNEVIIPERIDFNYEELKHELSEKVHIYETLVYGDDQIKEAKADKADLNKLKKALNDERIRREREYMAPFNDFKDKINEIISIIDKPISLIDKQVKEFEEKRKADKRVEIGQFWMEAKKNCAEWVTLPMIFDDRWLNASYSMKQIQDDITGWINRINTEVATIEGLPEFSFEALTEYKRSLDMNKAIAEGKRLSDIQKMKEAQEKKKAEEEAKKKAEEEAKKAEENLEKKEEPQAQVDMSQYMNPPTEPEKVEGQWISFKAKLTVPQALELKEFFKSRNIEFSAI